MTDSGSEPTRSRVAPECAKTVSKPFAITRDYRWMTSGRPSDNVLNPLVFASI